MKIFQTIQRHFAVFGITVNQSRGQSSICFNHLFVFLMLLSCISSQIICIISLAENFEDCTNCIHEAFKLSIAEAEFVVHIWKMKLLFKFIENFERLIGTSVEQVS